MSERPTLIAIDPGLTSGWAALYPDNEFRSGETRGAYDMLRSVYDLLQDRAFDWHIIVERYTITAETARKSRQYEALEIIGALKFFCAHFGYGISIQSPSEAKSFSTDAKLKKARMFMPGHGHANDAARHLLVYGIKNGYIMPETVI